VGERKEEKVMPENQATHIHTSAEYESCEECKARATRETRGTPTPGETESAWLIHYDDPERPIEVFCGENARGAAWKRYAQAQISWTCTLFQKVTDRPAARVSQPVAPPPNSLFFGKPFWEIQAELREKFNAEIVFPSPAEPVAPGASLSAQEWLDSHQIRLNDRGHYTYEGRTNLSLSLACVLEDFATYRGKHEETPNQSHPSPESQGETEKSGSSAQSLTSTSERSENSSETLSPAAALAGTQPAQERLKCKYCGEEQPDYRTMTGLAAIYSRIGCTKNCDGPHIYEGTITI
jgi:hypothetical protein